MNQVTPFQRLVEAVGRNDRGEAAQLIEQIDPREPLAMECTKLALRMRDAEWLPEASSILTRVVDKVPGNTSAYYELAFIHRLKGDPAGAAASLREAVESGADEWRFRSALVHMLYGAGQMAEADSLMLADIPSEGDDLVEWHALRQFGLFLRHFPRGRALDLIAEAKARHGWLDTNEVAAALVQAVRTRAPFALIRLGDGEGGNLRVDARDERMFAGLYARNRRELVGIWFGPSFDWNGEAFTRFIEGFPDLMSEADILGVPYVGWMEHEYDIASLRGIPSLVNVFRVLATRCPNFSGRLCSQLIHCDLHAAHNLEGVFEQLDDIGLISCFPELPDLLRRRFNFRNVDFIRIPGEFGSLQNEADLVDGRHFPDTFARVLSEIQETARGKVVLIAAGILGKAYAIAVKRAGGIGLDLGSLVDAWTGRATRPGYGDRFRL